MTIKFIILLQHKYTHAEESQILTSSRVQLRSEIICLENSLLDSFQQNKNKILEALNNNILFSLIILQCPQSFFSILTNLPIKYQKKNKLISKIYFAFREKNPSIEIGKRFSGGEKVREGEE